MTVQLTQEQKNIIKQLQDLEKDLTYFPINQSYISLSNKDTSKMVNSDLSHLQLLSYLQPSPEQSNPQYSKLEQKLFEYKARSNMIHSISTLIHEYDINFKHLQKQKTDLLKVIQGIHQQTSDLIRKQKKYIDLSNSVKQALDYYALLDKFQFNWVCEPSARQMFEDQLQPMLSELTDGIQFFTTNSNYSNSKKYLNGLIAAKTKVTSFTKSFFIKLLNKQYGFSIKNVKTQLHKSIDGFYPKSKPKFLLQFISCFPQLQKLLKIIVLSAKQTASQAQNNTLLRRQSQIDQFILNENSISLITYLQRNVPEVYEQVILKFISFCRINFHESFSLNLQNKPDQIQQNFQDYFKQVFVKSIYILTCEAAYIQYCFNSQTQIAKQYGRGTLSKIAQFYSSLLVKIAKQPGKPGKNKDPFKICNEVAYALEQCNRFFRNYSSRQYQTYIIGAVIHQVQKFGIESLTSIFQKIGQKIINQLENVCQNMLPKYKQTNQKAKLTQQIKQFVKLIPNLSYCPTQAQKYLITTLDTITKSIKQVSNRIQSRLECYAWNIQIFALIDSSLDRLPYNLIKKQMKIDIGETTSIIQKVKNVNRNDDLISYATQLFTVIKTGVPTLSQMTLDFNTYIKQYYKQLRQKFVKDMIFVHAKNMIQFLQSLKQADQTETSQLCEHNMMKNLHSRYKLSIQSYIVSAANIVELRRKQFAVFQEGEQNLINLLKQIKEALLDLMGTFYVELSKHTSYVQNFESLAEIRVKFSTLNLKEEQDRKN